MTETKPVSMREQARELYLSNPDLDYVAVAERLQIELETIRSWAQKGGWRARRAMARYADMPDDIAEQAESIRLVLMEAIINGENSSKGLSELVEAWKSTLDVRKEEAGVDRDEIIEE